MDGRQMEDFGGFRLAFPLIAMNAAGDDQQLSTAYYGRDGEYLNTEVNTDTLNADHAHDMAEWFERQDRRDALIERLIGEGVITDDDL